jgi:hypothetical protein
MAVPYMAVHRGHTIPSRADYAPRPSIRPDRIQTETAHRLSKNVTGQIPRPGWGRVTESGRWRAWRGRSACAREARSYRWLRSATERPAGLRRGGFSTSFAQSGWHRKHAIRALSSRESSASGRPRQRRRTYGIDSRCIDRVMGSIRPAVWQAAGEKAMFRAAGRTRTRKKPSCSGGFNVVVTSSCRRSSYAALMLATAILPVRRSSSASKETF